MKRGSTVLFLFCIILFEMTALVASAAEPQGMVAIENQKLALWYGEWTYKGKSFTTPLGPGAPFTGKLSGRPVQAGFASEFIYTEKGASGEVRYFEVDFWEQATKQYAYILVGNDGYAERGFFQVNGNMTVFEGNSVAGEKIYKVRGVNEFASDGKSWSRRNEISTDGKTWMPLSEATFTKIKRAAKK
jgi:hypothetical protein